MAELGKLWAGSLYGTNTGNLFARFELDKSEVTGLIRVMDHNFGISVYQINGTFDGGNLNLTGVASQAQEGVETGTVTVEGGLTPEGNIRGEWSSTIGSGGTFVLYPHDSSSQTPPGDSDTPEQLHTARRTLNAIQLFADDVRALIDYVQRDFSRGRVVATYHERGNEVSKYATQFMEDFAHLGSLRYLKLTVQEPEAHGINKVVTVELNAQGINEIRVQGVHEAWVTGKAESIASYLRPFQKALSTTFMRFGLNINALLLIALLVLLPELTTIQRLMFVLVILLASWSITKFHNNYIPNALIHLANKKPSIFERSWPQILSWVSSATAGLAAAIFYGVITGQFSDVWEWLRGMFD